MVGSVLLAEETEAFTENQCPDKLYPWSCMEYSHLELEKEEKRTKYDNQLGIF